MQEGGSQAIGRYFMGACLCLVSTNLSQMISSTWSEVAPAPASRKEKGARATAPALPHLCVSLKLTHSFQIPLART